MEREDAEFRGANERITTMAEDLRKAELVRDRLEGLDGSWASTQKATTFGRAWTKCPSGGRSKGSRKISESSLTLSGTPAATGISPRPWGPSSVARKGRGSVWGYPGHPFGCDYFSRSLARPSSS